MDWRVVAGVLAAAVVVIVVAVFLSGRRRRSGYISSSTEEQELLFRDLVQRVAPAVRGRIFRKEEVDEMLGSNQLYDQIVHYWFTVLLHRGTLSEASLRRAITGR